MYRRFSAMGEMGGNRPNLEIHGNERVSWARRTVLCLSLSLCRAQCYCFISALDKLENVETPTLAQLTHTLLFVPFRIGHGNCRLTPKCVPMVEKQNGGCCTLRDIERKCLSGISFLDLWILKDLCIGSGHCMYIYVDYLVTNRIT